MTATAVVNVNNIYIPNPCRVFVKPASRGASKFILGFPKDRREALAVDRLVFDQPALSDRACDRSGSRGRADKSAPALPGDPPATSAVCGVSRRLPRTPRAPPAPPRAAHRR